ncbi:MAG: hypothetical protein HY901_10430 [Deltaproteobacteria bacterium]|nr:hypothetical protein [Deltaproteobacteria bacterium]
MPQLWRAPANLLLAVTLLSCSQNVPHQPPVSADPLRFASFPVLHASAGERWSYRPVLDLSGKTEWTLAAAPDGAQVIDGVVSWTPGEQPAAAGEAFKLQARLGDRSAEQSFEVLVARHRVQAQTVVDPRRSDGTTVAVDAPLSPIHGAAVHLPADALSSSAGTVELRISSVENAPVPLSAKLAGLSASDLRPVELGPTGLAFRRPARLVLPVTPAVLATGSLVVQTFDFATGRWLSLVPRSVDSAAGLVVVEVSHFSTYVATPAVQGHAVCAADHLRVACDAIAAVPLAETCNGIDDDCNGTVDDQEPTTTGDVDNCGQCGLACPTAPNALAACVQGGCTLACAAGFANPNASTADGCECSLAEGGLEDCNGRDDDCDGQTDEGLDSQALYRGPPATAGIGECRIGERDCLVAGWVPVAPEVFPQPEQCDGLDNDCNGLTDDGNACPVTLADGGAVPHEYEYPCDDGLDGDHDGRTDCLDADCSGGEVYSRSCRVAGAPGFCTPGGTCVTCAAGASCGPGCTCHEAGLPAETDCADGLDNDFNGKVDCGEQECRGAPCHALTGPGICGVHFECVDCAAAADGTDCGPGCACAGGLRTEVFCGGGADDDGDGLTDCLDPDCAFQPCQGAGPGLCDDQGACLPNPLNCSPEGSSCGVGCTCVWGAMIEVDCTDGIDNNDNGKADCADRACFDKDCGPLCRCVQGVALELHCTDGLDNDRDQLADCADSDCDGHDCGAPGAGTFCAAGACLDCATAPDRASCGPSCYCFDGEKHEMDCTDGVDNDRNGVTDCVDPDCEGYQSLVEGWRCSNGVRAEVLCGDGLDNDGDGATDCLDSDCPCPEICHSGEDEDSDGLTDCADPDCEGVRCSQDPLEACHAGVCTTG